MELKLELENLAKEDNLTPLIVPYGIETLLINCFNFVSQTPLIVPYGIETA